MTNFELIIDRSLRKIEQDMDFFSYFNVDPAEAEALIREQIVGYIRDAVDLLTSKCEPDISFEYDEDNQCFTEDLTSGEIGLLSSLVYQVYFERQQAKLNAFRLRMNPGDLSTFSPANERTSFMNMLNTVRHENDIAISHYASVDRKTGARKSLEFSAIDE